jgi:hypothetical protein
MNALSLLDIRLAAEGAVAVHVELPELRAMQNARAVELWRDGLKIADIAKAVGLPVTTLRGWINNNRALFPFRRGDQAPPIEHLVETPAMLEGSKLWGDGRTIRQIAAALGVSTSTIVSWTRNRRDLFPIRRAAPNSHTPPVPPQSAEARAEQRLSEARRERFDYVPGIDATVRPAMSDLGGGSLGPISLLQLTERTCRWPISGTGIATRFCGCSIPLGRVYCEPHLARSQQGGSR